MGPRPAKASSKDGLEAAEEAIEAAGSGALDSAIPPAAGGGAIGGVLVSGAAAETLLMFPLLTVGSAGAGGAVDGAPLAPSFKLIFWRPEKASPPPTMLPEFVSGGFAAGG